MKITHATYLVSDELIARRFLSKVFGFVVIEEGLAIDGKKFLALGAPGGTGLQVQVIETKAQTDLSERKRAVGDDVNDSEANEDLLNVPAFLRRQAD